MLYFNTFSNSCFSLLFKWVSVRFTHLGKNLCVCFCSLCLEFSGDWSFLSWFVFVLWNDSFLSMAVFVWFSTLFTRYEKTAVLLMMLASCSCGLYSSQFNSWVFFFFFFLSEEILFQISTTFSEQKHCYFSSRWIVFNLYIYLYYLCFLYYLYIYVFRSKQNRLNTKISTTLIQILQSYT